MAPAFKSHGESIYAPVIAFPYENRFFSTFRNLFCVFDKALSQAIIYRWFKKLEDRASNALRKVLQMHMKLYAKEMRLVHNGLNNNSGRSLALRTYY